MAVAPPAVAAAAAAAALAALCLLLLRRRKRGFLGVELDDATSIELSTVAAADVPLSKRRESVSERKREMGKR